MRIATVHMNIFKCGYCSRAATITLSVLCGAYSRAAFIQGNTVDTIIKDIVISINIITLIYIMFQYNDTCMK